jgi:hypothetical protein
MATPAKKDLALIIGLLIPVVMIVFVAGAIYLPRVFSSVDPPGYDFVYMVGYPYRDGRYVVRDQRLVEQEVDPEKHYAPPNTGVEVQFFVHRVAGNTSERLSFEQAGMLRLDDSALSPDGFDIVPGRRSEFFIPIFATTDYRVRYLQKKGHAVKLELEVGAALCTSS